MPRVRFFGRIADIAGVARDDISGQTVDEVLRAARDRYGAAFTDASRTCRIWVNGHDPEAGMALRDEDEVALLPPVSGG